MDLKEQLFRQLDAAYDGNPWYGKSICQILEGIPPEKAFRHPPGKHVHSIAALLAHMIAWKQVLVDRLERNGQPNPRQRETFLTDSYGADPETAWRRLKERLEEQHRQLMQLIHQAAGKPGKLPMRLLLGILQHDVYHLGQIALLKKSS